jgi:hypothetical protein
MNAANLPSGDESKIYTRDDLLRIVTNATDFRSAREAMRLESEAVPEEAEGLVRIRGSDIVAKPLHPIWPGVLYRGKVMIFAGLPGDGKSLGTCDIVARVTSGGIWPTTNMKAEKGYAIIVTAEDDPEDTIRPRLDVAGADPHRYELITGVNRRNETGELELDTLSLLADIPKIEAVIAETHAAALIVDPLTSFTRADTNKTGEMRLLLDALAGLARRTGICIVIVTHLNKRADAKRAMHMIAGSHVIVAAVRTAYATAVDPNDKSRVLMLPLKLNIAAQEGGFAFRIKTRNHEVCGAVPYVEWETDRVTDLSADDALIDCTPRAQAAVEKTAEVQTWLRQMLAAGPVAAVTLWREAEEHDYSERRVRSALKSVKAICDVKGYQGKWHYWLPESDTKGTT